MGCSSSNRSYNLQEKEKSENENLSGQNDNDEEKESDEEEGDSNEDGSNKEKLQKVQKTVKIFGNAFKNYQFEVNGLPTSNLLLFTSINDLNSEFNSLIDRKEKHEKLTFKSANHGIALAYKKGYKLEFVNQDKFFILLDNQIEAYCLIDGHGPFGNKIAQICQELFMSFVTKINKITFESEYKKEFTNLFESVNMSIINRENLAFGSYDSYLSGAAITIIIKIANSIYCANVGNVLAILLNSDKLMPSKFSYTVLTINDSNISEEELNQMTVNNTGLNNNCKQGYNICNIGLNNSSMIKNYKSNLQNNPGVGLANPPNSNIINQNNINGVENPENINDTVNEIRRIYEHGGELRKLQGENKSRIFVKGKYFPGLINTRSLGDQIGKGIGVYSTPHINAYKMDKEGNYYLLMCTDGISNVINNDKLMSIIQANDVCKIFYKYIILFSIVLFESITNIITESKAFYRSHLYTPDMTIMFKELKFNDFS